MTDRDTASEAVFVGQIGDQVNIKILSSRSAFQSQDRLPRGCGCGSCSKLSRSVRFARP